MSEDHPFQILPNFYVSYYYKQQTIEDIERYCENPHKNKNIIYEFVIRCGIITFRCYWNASNPDKQKFLVGFGKVIIGINLMWIWKNIFLWRQIKKKIRCLTGVRKCGALFSVHVWVKTILSKSTNFYVLWYERQRMIEDIEKKLRQSPQK